MKTYAEKINRRSVDYPGLRHGAHCKCLRPAILKVKDDIGAAVWKDTVIRPAIAARPEAFDQPSKRFRRPNLVIGMHLFKNYTGGATSRR